MIADGAEEFAGNSENIHKVKKCLEKGVNKILVSENAIQKLNLRKALLIKLKGKVLVTLVIITFLPTFF